MKLAIRLLALGLGAVALALMILTTPASAQFTRVIELPATPVFSLFTKGDTVAAGLDSVVFISTNAGATWRKTARPAAGVFSIQSVQIRNGRMFVGTFGQGVHVSDDLGFTWQPFNQGLVGGLFESQLDVTSLEERGDSLYAGTSGAGVYVRRFTAPSTWSHFGAAFEDNQCSNVSDLTLGRTRLLASAGGNGQMLFHEPGAPDWTITNLDNQGLHPGVQAQTAAFNGTGWVVGTLVGVFRSVAGQEPWALSTPNPLFRFSWVAFANQGRHLFAAFDVINPNIVIVAESDDDGATWQNPENLPFVNIKEMAVVDNQLYTARADGLWRRSIATVSVPSPDAPRGLRFSISGPQPFGGSTRLHFELPEAGTAMIEVFDVSGRRATDRIEGRWSAGPHDVSLDARRLPPGVYAARLTAAGTSEVVRLVHVR